MKLEDVKEEPPVKLTQERSFPGGKVTIRSGGKLEEMSMEEFAARSLQREFWSKNYGCCGMPDNHLGGVRDDC